jgi:hypothetical protein
MEVQDPAWIRCVYAYLQRGTSDSQSAYLVKAHRTQSLVRGQTEPSRDGGATWEPLEYMGIAQALPTPFKTTYDFLAERGYGRPETRRLTYNDFGIVLYQVVAANADPQTVPTASYGANRLGFDVGEFVRINLEQADEEYVEVLSADPDNQTFTAVFTKDHPMGAFARPSGRRVLNAGDDLAFDILAVASPGPGADLTVVIQT